MQGPTRRALAASALALWAPGTLRAQPLPRLFSLIVGIDDYPFVQPLRGCVNDARLIEATVRPIATRLTLLIGSEATRGNFLRAWDAMANEARPGDTLLITFSGHGGQEPERRRGNEADGRDETLIFHAFHRERRPNNAERVIDDELGDRFSRTGARGIRSIFLADCCHAGTLTRSADPRVDGFAHRSAGFQNIQSDMLASLDIPPAEPTGQPNLLFIAAGQENQLVPEMAIEGRPHGATSFAFARAVTRAVATGAFPAPDAFAREVIAATRARVEGRHHPLAENTLPNSAPLFPLRIPPTPAQPAMPPAVSALRLHVMPGGGTLAEAARGLPGVQLMATRREADAVLDPARGELVSDLGDLLAASLDPSALAGAMEKLVALRLALASKLPAMEIGLVPRFTELAPGGANSRDERHTPGAEFDLVIRPPAGAGLVAVSLAAEGTVRLLSRPQDAVGMVGEFRAGVRVTPQRGASHVLALAVASQGQELLATLAPLDRGRVPRRAAQALLSAPRPLSLAVLGFFVG
jgi:hypothetical protein